MQNEVRRHIRKNLPKRGFVERHPRIIILSGVIFFTSIVFSKPIYDLCFSTSKPEKVKIKVKPTKIDKAEA